MSNTMDYLLFLIELNENKLTTAKRMYSKCSKDPSKGDKNAYAREIITLENFLDSLKRMFTIYKREHE